MKIAIVEDDTRFLMAMSELLISAGYEISAIPVFKTDDFVRVVGQIKLHNPDMILMDERLYTLRGFYILKELGGEFHRPGVLGGNPRVISISGAPCDDMKALVGGSFTKKAHLPHTGDELLIEVARCASRIV